MKKLTSPSKWFLATRPWSFPASVMPLLLGTVSASVNTGNFNLPNFLMALFAMLCLHSAGNVISDIFDFRKGLDNQITPTSGALARGLLTPKQMWAWASILIGTGSAIGIYLALTITPLILWIGLAGVIIGCSYTWLKYHALGDLTVFVNFATLGTLGGWMVQTAHFSWLPIFWSIPLGLLITAILHANNWRDTENDQKCGIQTVALRIGHKASAQYYRLLLLLALATAIALGQPLTTLLTLAALPKMAALWKTAKNYLISKDPQLVIDLDGRTAQLNLIFGLLYILGIGLGSFL
ncbi:prenyltransferase [Verrucomicrobiota bacterium]